VTAAFGLGKRRQALEDLYGKYNRREYVHPDPLEFLYNYDDPRDREIVGLVASSLAYGRVRQILRSVASVLDRMASPAKYLAGSTREGLEGTFAGFKHRFTTGRELALMLAGAKGAIERYGSLEACFASGMKDGDETVLPALREFAGQLNTLCGCGARSLVPEAGAGSACKRLNLYLRWMARRDEVDPGGWESVPARMLIVPVDTHMYRLCGALGMTRRKAADMRAALEITACFREIAPEDPVKYDFALTRLGIRSECDPRKFLECCGAREVA